MYLSEYPLYIAPLVYRYELILNHFVRVNTLNLLVYSRFGYLYTGRVKFEMTLPSKARILQRPMF